MESEISSEVSTEVSTQRLEDWHWRALGRLHRIAKCYPSLPSSLARQLPQHRVQSRGRGHSLAPVATLGTPSSALLQSYWLEAPPPPASLFSSRAFRLPWINSPGRLARSRGQDPQDATAFFTTLPTGQDREGR